MKMKDYKKHKRQKGHKHQFLIGMLVLSLLLNYISIHSIAYAAQDDTVSFDVGGGVSAVLNDGTLLLSGEGNTDDYSAQTAPFLAYAGEIHTLVIEEGISYLGAYLFYGLGELGGELVLPGSITGIGEYAFSGEQLESAPKFTIIRNQFVSAEITEQIQQEPQTDTSEDGSKLQQDEVTAMETKPSDEGVIPQEPEPSDEGGIPQEPEPADKDVIPQEPEPIQETPQEGEPQEQTVPTVQTRIITQQEIARPETLFAAGQTGFAICTGENNTFAAGALSAGYQVSDDSVKLILDDTVEIELPLTEGQVCLPECPEEIKAVHEENEFSSYEFVGWSRTQSENGENVAAAGEYLPSDGNEQMSLYSVWNTVSKYQLKTKASLEGNRAVYTLVNGDSEGIPEVPEGYAFFYQWQMAENGEGEMSWTDIEGEAGQTYERVAEGGDVNRQFRCKVTAVKQTRSRVANEPVVLYSEGINAVTKVYTVYVNQQSGSDEDAGYDGSKDRPFQSLTKAAEKLKAVNSDGKVEENKIVLLANYEMEKGNSQESEGVIFSGTEVAATISGESKEVSLLGGKVIKENDKLSDVTIEISGNIKFENLKLQDNHHIYGNGNDITFGENVVSKGTFLYGAERTPTGGKITKVGKINVQSGGFSRIVGYSRSYTSANGLQADNIEANITVNGGTVATIISGSASGAVHNANVVININGGTVTTIVGGNQGFSAAEAPFTGETVINVSGGEVGNIYGAGTGRQISIPTYQGELSVNVTAGNIKNIYGAGSAAYVISESGGVKSKINISATGGTIGNIFAAGKGNDASVTEEFNSSVIGDKPYDFGSLTGEADIEVGGEAVVTGNIYASGEGTDGNYQYKGDGLKENAYLHGKATITISGGTVKGNIYGGGKGIRTTGYEECARVKSGSKVKVTVQGGTVEGSVYGGGEIGKVEGDTEVVVAGGTIEKGLFGGGKNGAVIGNTNVTINSGTVKGNVYGGSENAVVKKKTHVTITGGTMESAVYGGALGEPGEILVKEGSTVNMTGGWVKRNLYGGSEKSDDGSGNEEETKDLIFVNLTGGVVGRNVFGGGYLGKVYGSTHVHIGEGAPDKCSYYTSEGTEEKPVLSSLNLQIEGSVYAGGDFGGEGTDYNTITVTGTSHVYIDGKGYNTGSNDANNNPEMNIGEGVFGSGASCDAGSTRLVTLDYYGTFANGDTTRKLTAIQRADRVLLLNSHVRLSGQSDIANANPTAPYSLNRIGNHENVTGEQLGSLGRGLVLQAGSTVILDSEAIGLGRFSSVDASGEPLTSAGVKETPNRIQFGSGTVFRVAYTKENESNLTYGAVSGYAYMQAGDTAEAFAYARMNTGEGTSDGGFVDAEGEVIPDHPGEGDAYRYWQMKTKESVSTREGVLTARELTASEPGYVDENYAVAKGVIELPQTTEETSYKVTSVTIPTDSGLQLVEAAKTDMSSDSQWVTSASNQTAGGETTTIQEAQDRISSNPLNTFGLYMAAGEGFEDTGASFGKIISQKSINSNDPNTIINAETGSSNSNVTPEIVFYLTYSNKNITASRDLGVVDIKLEGTSEGTKSVIDMKVKIVTKAAALSDQTVELYATQGGNYSGKLTIPAGASRSLSLTEVVTSRGEAFVSYDSESLSGEQFGINMQTVKPTDWIRNDLTTPVDLHDFSNVISIGTTDSRYDAELQFNLRNASGFSPKGADEVTLTFTDEHSNKATITLKINWKASIVSKVGLAGGREYDNTSKESSVIISPKSAVTSHFTISTQAESENVSLELIGAEAKTAMQLPAGTQLTLWNNSDFYCYEVTGNEQNSEIPLTSFKKMWGEANLDGNIMKDSVWSVIMDFSTVNELLTPGNYGLRLREESSADTQSDFFTVNNGKPNVTISSTSTEVLSRGKYTFTLSASANNDSRFLSGVSAVLVPEEGENFPVGAMVQYTDGDNTYTAYPRGGKIYLPMTSGSRTFTMNTLDTKGFKTGDMSFKVLLMPGGVSAGASWEKLISDSGSVKVTENPETALAVTRQDSGARIVKARDTLTFKAEYTSGEANPVITVEEQKKVDGTYSEVAAWEVTGNTDLAGTEPTITITVPQNIEAGTYRILFTLGEQQVVYNVIAE